MQATNPFLDQNLIASPQIAPVGTVQMQCATEYQHLPNLFRLPASSPFDNFLKAAGCWSERSKRSTFFRLVKNQVINQLEARRPHSYKTLLVDVGHNVYISYSIRVTRSQRCEQDWLMLVTFVSFNSFILYLSCFYYLNIFGSDCKRKVPCHLLLAQWSCKSAWSFKECNMF